MDEWKFDLGGALLGLFPGLIDAASDVAWDADDDPVVLIDLVFPTPDPAWQRPEDCRALCDRVKAAYSVWATMLKPVIEIDPDAVGVALIFLCPNLYPPLQTQN